MKLEYFHNIIERWFKDDVGYDFGEININDYN